MFENGVEMSDETNPFKNAQKQLDTSAEVMGLDRNAHAILREPEREIHVHIPVRMDSGQTKVLEGFRVQYNDARGCTTA